MTTISESLDRKSTRLNSSHQIISYAVFCLKKKNHRPEEGGRQDPRDPPPPRQGPGQPAGRRHALLVSFFFFNDTAPTEISPLSLHAALPISSGRELPIAEYSHRHGCSRRWAIPGRRGSESTRLNSSHQNHSYSLICFKK